MDEQDVHLDRLSHSINRQRDLSLQINDELEVHTGLLEGLDRDLDGTGERMRSARRRLDRVAKGAKENSESFSFQSPSCIPCACVRHCFESIPFATCGYEGMLTDTPPCSN